MTPPPPPAPATATATGPPTAAPPPRHPPSPANPTASASLSHRRNRARSSSIGRASALLPSGTLVSRILGFIRASAFLVIAVLGTLVALAGLGVFALLFGGASVNSSVDTWDASRIALLGGSATAGVAAQALILVAFWRSAGLSFRPDFRWRGIGLGRTGKAAGWTFGMILVTQFAGIFQSRVASLAADEGAGALTLQSSWLLFMLPHSVIAVSIALETVTSRLRRR